MSIILQPDEIEAITNRKRRSAQLLQLRRMGIECMVRADGFPIVSRDYWLRLMGAQTETKKSQVRLNLS